MKSNVCKIENGTRDLAAILKESEKVAVYNELSHKQTMQLRLLCEEADGMLPNIIDKFSGDFWIELENGVCRIYISFVFKDFTTEKKDGLVDISKNKKNASANSIAGKIRSAIENVFLDAEPTRNFNISELSYYPMGLNDCTDYSSLWSLDRYRSTVTNDKRTEEWDELEKSVIASVADDVIVGVKGKHADIIIVKKFA
jgi:hypothetical protein